MANRLTKWFFFTIFFGFIPIGISLLLTYLLSITINTSNFVGEILFYTVMISSTSLSDTIELNRVVKDFVITIFIVFFILLVLLSSVLYGSLLYGQLSNSTSNSFSEKLFYISLILAIVGSILGTIIQILLSRTEVSS